MRGNQLKNLPIRIGAVVTVAGVAALTLVGAAAPANAATGPATQCIIEPFHTNVVHHDDLWRIDTTTVPGKDAVVYDEQRWSKAVPAIKEVSVLETKYERVIPGNEEVSHMQWLYKWFVPAVKEESHKEYRFFKLNNGQAATSYQVQQFYRNIPAQAEKSHQEFKYQQVTKNSHAENKYKKTIKVYTVEHKKIQIPAQGKDHDKLVAWLTNIGAANLGNNWWQLPDATVAAAGINPFNVAQSGNVNTSAYGGPAVTVSYQITGIETYDQPPAGSFVSLGNQTVYYTGGTTFSLVANNAIWTKDTPAGYSSFASRTVNDPDTVTLYKGGAWTPDVLGAPWVKTDEKKVVLPGDEAVAARTEYLKADGTPTINPAEAGKFKEKSFPGWNQYGPSVTVPDKEYIAPFNEYLKADGTTSPNEVDAAWLTTPVVAGYEQFGASKVEITVKAEPSHTFYLTKDAQGNLGRTEVKSEASLFTKDDAAVDPKWVKIDEEKIVNPGDEATPDKTVYLTQTDAGVFGESEDIDDATWIPVATAIDLTIWQQMVDEHGDPLVNKHVTTKAEDGYTVFFNPTGEPTRELGEKNWTKMTPEGWTFVDSRTVEETKAVPPLVNQVKVLDKGAYDENVNVAAKYGPCASGVLASTGGELPWGGLLFATTALTLGLGLAIRARHRKVGPAI